jgi:hypothetical protein
MIFGRFPEENEGQGQRAPERRTYDRAAGNSVVEDDRERLKRQ